MRLHITIEAQNCDENGLTQIMAETVKELDFVTNKTSNLESKNNYGTEFTSISIIPSCMDENFWTAFGWKERKQIWHKRRDADIRLRMDYDRFMRETSENKRLLFIDIIIKSIQVVAEHSRGDFKGEKLINDVLSAVNVTMEQLKQLNAV